jgi:uncharacterized protein with PQ loop repeat
MRKRGVVTSPKEGTPLVVALDRWIFVVGTLGPLSTLPQIWKIWHYQNATGVSAFAWALPALFDLFWIAYGIVHKEKPIAFTYTLWFILNTLIAVGALLYG